MSARTLANFHRRDVLHTLAMGLTGVSASGWLPRLAQADASGQQRRRHCVLLWMTGGPSQIDTFDLKPEHENGGEFKPIQTTVEGLQISEHLPKLAGMAEHLAIVRSLSTKEGDHARGTYLMHTGRVPGGPIQWPTLGAALSKELGTDDSELPNFISIAPYRAFNRDAFLPGFLGPRHAALTVGAADAFQAVQPQQNQAGYAELGVDDLKPPEAVSAAQVESRLNLLRMLQTGFVDTHLTAAPLAHRTVYERAIRMMHSEAARAFDLADEPDKIRDAYGRGRFGQGCLMARRLIERGVPFIEVSLGSFGGGSLGWDTHQNNFSTVKNLSEELDAGWSSLMAELHDRGLLESTTILWMGEFGRTPKMARAAGRDHYPRAWTCVLAGGGIRGGQAYGRTSADGTEVEDGRVDVGDVQATLCRAVGIDPATHNISSVGRPVQIAEGQPIRDILV